MTEAETPQPEREPNEPPVPENESPERRELRERIVDAMRTVYDPEIPVNIYDIGLIYEINIGEDNAVDTKMTLTAPNCPAAGTLPGEVETKVRQVEGVKDSRVEVVWDPQWTMDRMSEAAKLQLGML